MEKKKQRFKLIDFKWLFLVSAVVITGGVMAFGLVMEFTMEIDQKNAIIMIAMVIPMVCVAGVVTATILHFVRKKMGILLDAISEVAEGNLDVQISNTDAGEYKVIYETFNHMTEEIKNTKAEMQNFINEFSHEFKTPITSISGFSKYLIETGQEIETTERMEYLQVIANESSRLASLSQKTLLLTKIEACQIIPDKCSYNLTEQLRHSIITLLPEIEKKQIEVSIDAEDVFYNGNPEYMEQIWLNLINNAIKFTHNKGMIEIFVLNRKDSISVSIKDNGIGMDEKTASKVFDKYFQADTQNAVRGSGIGLSIVLRIAGLCGGSVSVESKVGEGSTFTVELPK